MRLADFLAAALGELGIRHVFGVTGRGSLYLTDGIARSTDVEFVPLFHEQSAGFAANAVVQSGKPWSACMVSSGVAATNLFTPMLNAWQDQLNTLFITGQNHSSSSTSVVSTTIRTFGEQETNVVGMSRYLTKSTLFVDEPQLFPHRFASIIEDSRLGRPGPILLDIPIDHQSARIVDDESVTSALARLRATPLTPYSNQDSRQFAWPNWMEADHVDEGGGVLFLLGPSFDQLLSPEFVFELEKASNVVVVCEQGANSRYNGSNFIGTVGFLACNPSANKALFEAERIVAVGTSFRNNLCLPNQSLVNGNAEIFLVDFDSQDVSPHLKPGKMFFSPPSLRVEAGLRDVLKSRDSWQAHSRTEATGCEVRDQESLVDLNLFAHELGNLLPKDALVVVDSGFCQLIVSGQGRFSKEQRLVQPHSQGCMGVALAAGFGVAKSHPDKPVVIIVGDGSLVMNPQDLLSIASLPENLQVVVVDNDLYAIINKRQRELFRNRTIGTSESDGLPRVDLKMMLEGFGLQVEDERGKGLQEICTLREFKTNKETKAILISGSPSQGITSCKVVSDPSLGDARLEISSPSTK